MPTSSSSAPPPRFVEELDDDQELEFSSEDEIDDDEQELITRNSTTQFVNGEEEQFSLDDEEEDFSLSDDDDDDTNTRNNMNKVKLPTPSKNLKKRPTGERDPFFSIENEERKRKLRMESERQKQMLEKHQNELEEYYHQTETTMSMNKNSSPPPLSAFSAPHQNEKTHRQNKTKTMRRRKPKTEDDEATTSAETSQRKTAVTFDSTTTTTTNKLDDHQTHSQESSQFLASSESDAFFFANDENNGDNTQQSTHRKRRSSETTNQTSTSTSIVYKCFSKIKKSLFYSVAFTRNSNIGQKIRSVDDTALSVICFITLILAILLATAMTHRSLQHRHQTQQLREMEDRIDTFRRNIESYEMDWSNVPVETKTRKSSMMENNNSSSATTFSGWIWELMFSSNQQQNQQQNSIDTNNNQDSITKTNTNNDLSKLLEENSPDSADFLRYTPLDVNLGNDFETASIIDLKRNERTFELMSSSSASSSSSSTASFRGGNYHHFDFDDENIFDLKLVDSPLYSTSSSSNNNNNNKLNFVDQRFRQVSLIEKVQPHPAEFFNDADFFVSVNFSAEAWSFRKKYEHKKNWNTNNDVDNDNFVPLLASDLEEMKQNFFHQEDVASKLSLTVKNTVSAEEAAAENLRVFLGVDEVEDFVMKTKKTKEEHDNDNNQHHDSLPVFNAAPVEERGYRAVVSKEHSSASRNDDNNNHNNYQKRKHIDLRDIKDPLDAAAKVFAEDALMNNNGNEDKYYYNNNNNDNNVPSSSNMNNINNRHKSWSDKLYLCHVCVLVKVVKDDHNIHDQDSKTKKRNYHFELVRQSSSSSSSDNNNDDNVLKSKQVSSCHYPFTHQSYCELSFSDLDPQVIEGEKQRELEERKKLVEKKFRMQQQGLAMFDDGGDKNNQQQKQQDSIKIGEIDGEIENPRDSEEEKRLFLESKKRKLQQRQSQLRSIDLLQPRVLFEVRLWNDPEVQYQILTEGDPKRFKKELYDLRKKFVMSETSPKQKIFWAVSLTFLVTVLCFAAAELFGRKIQRSQFVRAYLRKQQQSGNVMKHVVVGGGNKEKEM